MSDSLKELRASLIKDSKPLLVKGNEDSSPTTDNITEASYLKIPSNKDFKYYSLDDKTRFVIDDVEQPLKVVVQCYLHQNSSGTDYIADCEQKNIPTVAFVQRTDLITWLIGASDDSEYIKKDKASIKPTEEIVKKEKIEDPFLKAILSNEREILNHNSSLRGNKASDFHSIIKECENRVVKQLKRKAASSAPAPSNTIKKNQKTKPKDPIIIISPSSSSLLSMNNVKEFLQNGVFADPNSLPKHSENLLLLSRKSERLGNMRFLVVDSIERFNKPEYWDRVVAIFTTGQKWQFKHYKYTEPNQLFQKYKGFFVSYNGDIIPPQIKEWNVQNITLDRNRRFRDRQLVESFWDSLEMHMLSKGYSKQ